MNKKDIQELQSNYDLISEADGYTLPPVGEDIPYKGSQKHQGVVKLSENIKSAANTIDSMIKRIPPKYNSEAFSDVDISKLQEALDNLTSVIKDFRKFF